MLESITSTFAKENFLHQKERKTEKSFQTKKKENKEAKKAKLVF